VAKAGCFFTGPVFISSINTMRVLLTGANGFLGYYLAESLIQRGHDVIATGRGESRLPYRSHASLHYVVMDFTDPFRVHDVFAHYRPEVVIHSGAMTRVDDCEVHQWNAYMANVEGTLNLLSNAEELHCHFIFLSTDFVFDGSRGMYTEKDQPSPVNFYGKTKWEAEQAVMEYPSDWAIVRTIHVYGEPKTGNPNFLFVLKQKLEKGENYMVVTDQFRMPTYVGDLVKGIIAILEKKATGVFHLSGKDLLTPYDMAIRTARLLGLDEKLIQPATAMTFTQPGRRPPRTGFVIEKARKELEYDPVSFEEGLKLTFSSSIKH
jgi:dTDP-4-dehydrorhamnose reductase